MRSMPLRKFSALAFLAAVAALAAFLAGGSLGLAATGGHASPHAVGLPGSVSLQVLAPKPNQRVTGPDLALHVRANGYQLNAGFAGTPNLATIGHYHEILDGKLVDMTPLQDPTRDAMSMVGVTPGRHVLTLVPANNNHRMIMPRAVMVPFLYTGPFRPQPAGYTGTGTPSIAIISPAAGSTVDGKSFTITAKVSNFVLSGESFGKKLIAGEGHWHIFLDKVNMAHMLTMASGDTQTGAAARRHAGQAHVHRPARRQPPDADQADGDDHGHPARPLVAPNQTGIASKGVPR